MNSEIGYIWAKLLSRLKHDTKENDKLKFFASKGIKFTGGGKAFIYILISQKMNLILFQ